MAERNTGSSSAVIVGIVAIIAIVILVYLIFLRQPADQNGDVDIQIEDPTEQVEPPGNN
ncbi:MAG: hypothetical protein ACOCSK_00580 [Rhodothermales bacterium]